MDGIIIESMEVWREGIGVATKVGRQCNTICPFGDKDIQWTAGSIIGGILAGPWGMIYGRERPSESLQDLCRALGKLHYMKKDREDSDTINAQNKVVKKNSWW